MVSMITDEIDKNHENYIRKEKGKRLKVKEISRLFELDGIKLDNIQRCRQCSNLMMLHDARKLG